MKKFILAILLVSCSAPSFSFESPCSIPAKVTHFKEVSNKGCWRIRAQPGYGVTLEDPGLLSCDTGSTCIVIVDQEPFWIVGAGNDVWAPEDVDCSEVCP